MMTPVKFTDSDTEITESSHLPSNKRIRRKNRFCHSDESDHNSHRRHMIMTNQEIRQCSKQEYEGESEEEPVQKKPTMKMSRTLPELPSQISTLHDISVITTSTNYPEKELSEDNAGRQQYVLRDMHMETPDVCTPELVLKIESDWVSDEEVTAYKKNTNITPNSSGNLASISKDDVLGIKESLKKTHDMTVSMYRLVDEVKARIIRLEKDVSKIKVALMQKLPEEEESIEVAFRMEIRETVDEFEQFCDGLRDSDLRKLVTRFMITTYSRKGIGETVRLILKASMSDEVMAKYNRTGTRGMKKLPELFEKCIFAAVKSFHKESEEITVRRGREEITTTVKRETGKQLEVFLSNAASRLKRKILYEAN